MFCRFKILKSHSANHICDLLIMSLSKYYSLWFSPAPSDSLRFSPALSLPHQSRLITNAFRVSFMQNMHA